MRNVFYFAGYQLRRYFTTPRTYLTLFLVFAATWGLFGGAIAYLQQSGETLQAAEFYLLAFSSWISPIPLLLGILFLLADAPFLKQGMDLRLMRTSRLRWLGGQMLACAAIIVIYLVWVELCFLLMFRGSLAFGNRWSHIFTLTLQTHMAGPLMNAMRTVLYLPATVLRAGMPWEMFVRTFVYQYLLYFLFAMLLIVCNLRFRIGSGVLAVAVCVFIHGLQQYEYWPEFLRYLSPCGLTDPCFQSFTTAEVVFTISYFVVLHIILAILAYYLTQKVDLVQAEPAQ